MAEQVIADSRRAEIGRARREKMHAKLISAAARVIARLGQGKATIDDFIQAAGVARGTFYNHFPTRAHIIDALWAHVGRKPFLEIHDRSRKIGDPALRIVTETKLVLARADSDEVWGWLVHSLSGDFEEVNDDLLAFPLPTLKEGLASGRFDIRDLGAARDAVVNIVRGGLLATLMQRSSPAYEQAMCEMILLCLGLNREEAASLAVRPLDVPAPESG